ncbi:hypothetical protein [Singulisphaera acidiphila]|nr:hypothetical protein [Singulisphaera acidiphila]
MALIVVIAADLAALRPVFPLEISIFWTSYPWSVMRESLPPRFPNLGLVILILVLEVGLFRLVSRQGVKRTFWLGFEVAGWACAIMCSVFARTIWGQVRLLFEGGFLGREIGQPSDMGRFVLFVGGLHLLISLAIAFLIGNLACSVWRRRRPLSSGSEKDPRRMSAG